MNKGVLLSLYWIAVGLYLQDGLYSVGLVGFYLIQVVRLTT